MPSRASTRTALCTGAVLGAIAFGLPDAQAGGLFVHEQGAYFQGTSFAGVAAGGPSLSAMFWNPATITQHGLGLTSEINATAIFPMGDITPIVATSGTGANLLPLGRSGDIGSDAFLPASYYVYGLNNWLSFGLALNSPFGLNSAASPIWAGMFYSRQSQVFSVNASPTIAVKINDWLSVGAGAQIQYFKAKSHSAFPGSGIVPPFGPPMPESLRIDGDSTDYGFTAGVTLSPTPWTRIGLGYRSRIDHSLEGDIFRPAFVIPTPTAVLAIPQLFVNFTVDVPLPDIASVSIRQKMTEAFTVLATVEWTNWSRLGTIPVAIVQHGPNIGIPTTLPFEWRDGWLFSGAAEYRWTQSVAVRAGIGWERSPVTDQVRGTQLPDNDRLWVSAGLTYDWNERLSLELGYSHIVVKETPINIVPGNPLFTPSFGSFIGTANAQVDIISLALRYRWFPGAAPYVVTKG